MEDSSVTEAISKAKTSKTAIVCLVLSLLSLLFIILAAFAILCGIVAVKEIKRSRGEMKGKVLALAGIVISTISLLNVATFLIWNIDAPPIPDDYTVADLRSAGPEHAESYQLLMSLDDEGYIDPNKAPAIGLFAEHIKILNKIHNLIKGEDYVKTAEVVANNAESIEQIWAKAQKGRDIIHQLNGFCQIADLTELSYEEANIDFVFNLYQLVKLYRMKLCLECEHGVDESNIEELLELDSVLRKLSINSRSRRTKLICYMGLSDFIESANFAVNKQRTSPEALRLLREHFSPLSDECIALRNPIICEYIKLRKLWHSQFDGLSNIKKPALKLNSTLRLYKNFWDNWLYIVGELDESQQSALSVWPTSYPGWLPSLIGHEVGGVPLVYMIYNPIGAILFKMTTPQFDSQFESKTKIHVLDDLFQIVLNQRLGREFSLKARAYSDEYIIDAEKKIIFSSGPDGKSYTKDDISLAINPEVLNLME